MTNKKVLLAYYGGMDSTTLLYIAMKQFNQVDTISYNYGQKHASVEIACAQYLTKLNNLNHEVVDIPFLGKIGGSTLTTNNEVPKYSDNKQADTIVPMRNTILTSIATAIARTRDIDTVAFGPVADDFEIYEDCKSDYVESLEKTLTLGNRGRVPIKIWTPLIQMWKNEVVKVGLELKVPFEYTHSCYRGSTPGCFYTDVIAELKSTDLRTIQQYGLEHKLGCPSCFERIRAFELNNMVDPLFTRLRSEGNI